MTSTTEELRRLLDERGVEYQKIGKRLTYWNRDGSHNDCDDADYVADEKNGSLTLEGIAPERAVAATLEDGVERSKTEYAALTAEQVREAVEKHWHDLPYEYDMPEATALPEYSYDWQAIADELNAELGSGTCEMETDWDYLHDGIPDAPEDTWAYVCSACEWSFRYDRGIKPNYCPNCGAKVIGG